MSKKELKTSGMVFTILTFISLLFPWVYAYYGEKFEKCDFTTTGFDMIEFSVWGVILILVPILVLGIMYGRLNEKEKTVSLLVLYLLGNISFYFAVSMGMDWLREASTGYIRLKGFALLYPIFLLGSMVMFYLYCNGKDKADIEEFVGEVYLCSTPYTFRKLDKEKTATVEGCISFFTKEGYFAALGRMEKDGSIEVFDGEENAGFVLNGRAFGTYGAFYEDYTPGKSKKMRILSFENIEQGEAELWIPGEKGFVKKLVEITPKSPTYIECKPDEEEKLLESACGAVIVQDGKIAAIVTEYNTENGVYNCVSAARVAVPLACIVQEQKILQSEPITKKSIHQNF